MRQGRQSAAATPGLETSHGALDVVVPFTTPRLTATALRAATRLGGGLIPAIRLLRIQVVPFPLEVTYPPVALDFLREQLSEIHRGYNAVCEIRLAREFEAGLISALREDSVVLLAKYHRPWPTRSERLAGSLRRAGYTVLLVRHGDEENA